MLLSEQMLRECWIPLRAELQALHLRPSSQLEAEAMLDGLSLQGQRHETLEPISLVFVSLPKRIA